MTNKNFTPLESWEQEQFFKWVYSNQIRWPELKLINGSMNGVKVTPKVMEKLKGQGLRKGFPDIDVPIARHGYHGLKIELKRRQGGRVSDDQKRIHELLSGQGYLVNVCCGWSEAVNVTKGYLGIR